MEEYRDFALTVEMFKKTLSKEEFKNFYGGIAIQAYLPDSFIYLKDLTAWAKKRVENGGSPIKVRLVKGANMEMEESSTLRWDIEKMYGQVLCSRESHSQVSPGQQVAGISM